MVYCTRLHVHCRIARLERVSIVTVPVTTSPAKYPHLARLIVAVVGPLSQHMQQILPSVWLIMTGS